ncbi:carbohydrate ABC transporter permease [Paenibacillus sp. D51F]|uniref:carbohydrate ABC transporter permease n=1 Tax=unclassified Paenibacillus TaxID=185978 RepID=UPI0009565845|nr:MULTISPECIES: sugar ABC transporter permease [unclassified Paenibacillus]ASS66505.1 sugar ABC transporter permease [Paenibacillus sp. RUD330]SIQ02364.1 multiple sugar transport system permease protein [Paenibacillus sp. RU4X]SIQ21801.1 multiple sugar transport system permease protein [Paenibacillus sp. RU4T]
MKSAWTSRLTSFLFILPYLAAFGLFLLFPILYGVVISLQDFELLSAEHAFVGLSNYVTIFTPGTYENSLFFKGLWTTAQFVLYSVPLLIVIGLGLAMLLNALPARVRGLFRTFYFLPYALSASVMAVIWLMMFDTNAGFLNSLLAKLGMAGIPWLTDTPWAWISLVSTTIWWTIGFNMIIFINALNEVPEEYYEAASIDGAGPWSRFVSITLPTIRPVMLFVMITSTIASFNIYAQPFLLTRGGPGDTTRVLLINVLDQAFARKDVGSASAMAILMAVLIMAVSVVQFKLTNRKEKA